MLGEHMLRLNWDHVVFLAWWVPLLTLGIGGISAAPWVPSLKRERKAVAEGVPVRAGAKVYDLGSGDGSMLFAMAERYPDARYVGYEIAIPPWLIGLARKLFGGKKYVNVSLRYGDLFGRDVSDGDFVFVYLLQKAYPRIVKKFAAEAKDDAVIVIEGWAIPGVTFDRKIAVERGLPMFVYSGASFRRAQHQEPV